MAGIGNVGDSRVYTLDKTGTLTQATLDDGPIRYAMMNGSEAGMRVVQTRLNNARGPSMLSSDERSLFSGRHLMTQVLGDKVIEPRVTTCMLQDGWTVILMTDGVHDNLTDDEIGDILRGAVGSADAAATLLAHARQRMDEGGFRSHLDDMAVIVVTSGNGGAPKLHVLESEGAVPSGNSGRLPRVQSRE